MLVVALSAVALAALLRAAVLQKRLMRVAAQAITDPLTNAFNRRHLETCLRMAIARQRRTGEAASLLVFDVDRFKRINDAVGHSAGDRVLRMLATLVRERARRLDVLFRIGGEEFALLLAGATLSSATEMAEQLRRLVEQARLVEGCDVSISIGVSDLRHGLSPEAWLEDADIALYRAKRAGRNRVECRSLDALEHARDAESRFAPASAPPQSREYPDCPPGIGEGTPFSPSSLGAVE